MTSHWTVIMTTPTGTGPIMINSGNDVTLDCYYNYRYGTSKWSTTEMTSQRTVTITKGTGTVVIHNENDVTMDCCYKYCTLQKKVCDFPVPSRDFTNEAFPGHGEFGLWHPGWGRENRKPFLQRTGTGPVVIHNRNDVTMDCCYNYRYRISSYPQRKWRHTRLLL